MATISNKFANRLFRRINGVVWDLLTGKIGLKTPDGIFTTDGAGTDESPLTVTVNPIDVGSFTLPGIALLTQIADLQVGDIVVGDRQIIGFVTGTTAAAVKVIDVQGQHKTFSPPKVAIGGQTGILAVKNLFNLTGGADQANGFANTLLPMLVLLGDKGDDDTLTTLMMVQALSGANGAATAGAPAAGGMNPLMLLALAGDKSGLGGGAGGIDAKTLLLMGGLGGAGGAGGMNAMLPLLLLKDGGLGGSSGGGIDTKTLLLMSSLGGGANLAGNPLLMMAMLGDNAGTATTELPAPVSAGVPPLVPALRPL